LRKKKRKQTKPANEKHLIVVQLLKLLHWLAQSVSQLVSLSDFVVYIRADRLSRAIQVHYAPNNKGPGYLRLSLRRRLRLGLSGIVVEAPPFPANVW